MTEQGVSEHVQTFAAWLDEQIKSAEARKWNLARSTDAYRKGQVAGQLATLEVVRRALADLPHECGCSVTCGDLPQDQDASNAVCKRLPA